MVTIIITIKLFHLFISALCAAVFLDSVNLTETFPVSLGLFPLYRFQSSQGSYMVSASIWGQFTDGGGKNCQLFLSL